MYADMGPAVPLSALMADTGLAITRAGGPADDVLVHSVGTTELSDPAPYVMPGELLLTSGMGLPRSQPELEVYVSRLAEEGIAAMGIGIEPVLDEVPPELIAACDAQDVRLLRLPPTTPFAAVSQSFSRAMARRAQREFEQEAQAQGALIGAAGGSDPIRGIVRQLARWIGTSTVLLDPDGNRLATGGRPQSDAVVDIMREHATTLQRAETDQSAAAVFGTRLHLRAYAVPTGSPAGSRLILAVVGGDAPTLSQRRTIATCLWLLALLVSPRYTLDARVEGIGALVRLLTGASDSDLDALLRRGADADGDQWVVVRGRIVSTASAPARDLSVDVATLRTLLSTPYLDLDRNQLTALIPCRADAPPAPPAEADRLGWVLGYSAPSSFNALASARAQADGSLRKAISRAQPAHVHGPARMTLDALVADGEERPAFARAVLGPLGDAAREPTRSLIATLHTWLGCHGSTERTARALEIHRNTVRNRLAQISSVLAVDLDDPDTRAALWLATSWVDPSAGTVG